MLYGIKKKKKTFILKWYQLKMTLADQEDIWEFQEVSISLV